MRAKTEATMARTIPVMPMGRPGPGKGQQLAPGTFHIHRLHRHMGFIMQIRHVPIPPSGQRDLPVDLAGFQQLRMGALPRLFP